VEEKTKEDGAAAKLQSYNHQMSDDPPDVRCEHAQASQKNRKQCTLQRPDD
jgi:hypothetical protein